MYYLTRVSYIVASSRGSRYLKSNNEHNLNQIARQAKTTLRHDVNEVLTSDDVDFSSDYSPSTDDSLAGSPEDDDENSLLSYDISGHTVLSDAVNKAVEHYETKETEKITKDYEFVSHENDDDGIHGYVDGDDFEFIDSVNI